MRARLSLDNVQPIAETDADAFADELAELTYQHGVALRLRSNAMKLGSKPKEAAACFSRFAWRLDQLATMEGERRRKIDRQAKAAAAAIPRAPRRKLPAKPGD